MTTTGRNLARTRVGGRLLAAMAAAAIGLLVPAAAAQASETAAMCTNGVVPPDWVVTSLTYSSSCPSFSSNPFGDNQYSILHTKPEPKGATVVMCAQFPTPAGWIEVSVDKFATNCGGGFTYNNGTRRIQKVVDGPAQPKPQPQPVVNHNPRGAFDAVWSPNPGRVRVSGWTVDDDQPKTPIAIRVWSGGVMLREAMADQNRPDVASAFPAIGPNHGYNVGMNAPSGQTIVVCVKGVNVGQGANTNLGCKSVRVM